MQAFSVFYSNQVEELFERLKQQLFPARPFSRRLIVVPSPPLKSWLMLQFAKDPELGIAAGLEISYPDEMLHRLGVQDAGFPPFLELALKIEKTIDNQIQKGIRNENWAPLYKYLEEGASSRKMQRRTILLSAQLAQLFLHYRHYGREMVQEWVEARSHWQAEIWHALQLPFTSPSVSTKSASDVELHLFSISHLSPFHLDCFSAVARQIPTHFYHLSPCKIFWSDIRSNRESRRLHAFWKAKGASEGELKALDEYLRTCHPILANFGRLGREMVQQFEERAEISDEKYVLPVSAFAHPVYADLVHDVLPKGPERPLLLLEALQADLLLMRMPSGEAPPETHSIQVHVADTKLRETQVVHNLILQLIAKHSQDESPLKPEEILVMAPDIMEYAPFIKMIFQSSDKPLDFHIMEVVAASDNPLYSGFLQLLKLAQGRWTAEEVMELFEIPAFRKKQRIEDEELILLKDWIRSSGVRWGYSSEHRDEVLKEQHCLSGMGERSDFGTWEKAEDILLNGLIYDDEEVVIDSKQAVLLGKFLYLLRSLRESLSHLQNERTLHEWANALQDILDSFFEDEEEQLSLHFDAFREAAKQIPEEKFSNASILYHLEERFKRQRTSYRETHLNAVRFCPLLPMRTVPAKVIMLMGMQEGSFPRYEGNCSLDFLKGHSATFINSSQGSAERGNARSKQSGPNDEAIASAMAEEEDLSGKAAAGRYPDEFMKVAGHSKAHYSPTKSDFDRYLFLEALLSARRYFIVTYQGYSPQDSKEQSPSLLVQELTSYLRRAYQIQEKDLIVQHPFHAFEKRYFEHGAAFPNYSKKQFCLAQAFYGSEKKTPLVTLPKFQIKIAQDVGAEFHVNLRDLGAFAKNPLKIYFNKALGLYLPQEQEWENEEQFTLNSLDTYQLRKLALTNNLNQVLDKVKHQLPFGIFKEIALKTIVETTEEIHSNLQKVSVRPKDIFTIQLQEGLHKPIEASENEWKVPSLMLTTSEGTKVTLEGKLELVAPQGLIVIHENRCEKAVQHLPHFLVFEALAKRGDLPLQRQLIFSRSGKAQSSFTDHPEKELVRYLDHYFQGMKAPSALLPEWVPALLSHNKKKLEESLSNSYNRELLYLMRGQKLDTDSLLAQWAPTAQELFGDLNKNWYSA